MTEFADEYPAGSDSIHKLAGKDRTEAFAAEHNKRILEDFSDEQVGLQKSQQKRGALTYRRTNRVCRLKILR